VRVGIRQLLGVTLLPVVLGLYACTDSESPTSPGIIRAVDPPSKILVPPDCDGSYTHFVGQYHLTQEQCDEIAVILALMQYTGDPTCASMYGSIYNRFESNWIRHAPISNHWSYMTAGWPYTVMTPLGWIQGGETIGGLLWHEEAHHRWGDDEPTATYWENHCKNSVQW